MIIWNHLHARSDNTCYKNLWIREALLFIRWLTVDNSPRLKVFYPFKVSWSESCVISAAQMVQRGLRGITAPSRAKNIYHWEAKKWFRMDQQKFQPTEILLKVELRDNWGNKTQNCLENINESTGAKMLQWEKLRAKLDSGAPNILENKMPFLILLLFSG